MHEQKNQKRNTQQDRYRTEYSAAESVHSLERKPKSQHSELAGSRLNAQLGERLIQDLERMIDLILINV
jgi:hypothetical protein